MTYQKGLLRQYNHFESKLCHLHLYENGQEVKTGIGGKTKS